tara:strand:+ start:737 stop:1324 length:588 start_codon:yes stop_codon:yes gene_type:complete
MKIIDNFLEHDVFQKLQNDVRFKLQWNYNDGIDYFEPDGKGNEKPTEEELKKDKFQFVHTFYKDSQPFSDSISILDPVFLKLQPQVIARVKANILTRTPKIIENEFHVDLGFLNKEQCKQFSTSILYMNTNNGYTKFEDGTKVESVANRLVTFPATMMHTGTSCTDKKIRIVINFNYMEYKGNTNWSINSDGNKI